MITPRGMANQSLYYASVLLSSWREQIDNQQVPAHVLNVAFGAGVCEHLRQSYGWFLLSLVGIKNLPESPPKCVNDLPELAEDAVLCAEIREFSQLEQRDWLARLLAAKVKPEHLGSRPHQSLAGEISNDYDWFVQKDWHERLSTLFERMSQSLDEC